MTTTVHISIGNSDDKLTQREWAGFHQMIDGAIRRHAERVHGSWVSPSTDPWQNACWAIEVAEGYDRSLRSVLSKYAAEYRQDSVAWTPGATEFITPPADPAPACPPPGGPAPRPTA